MSEVSGQDAITQFSVKAPYQINAGVVQSALLVSTLKRSCVTSYWSLLVDKFHVLLEKPIRTHRTQNIFVVRNPKLHVSAFS